MVTSKLFASPTISSFLNKLHPSDTPIMKTLQDFNSYPTSYIHSTHNINSFFFKTTDASVVSWLQYITLHKDLFNRATLWILHTRLTTSLKNFYLDIIFNYLRTSWTFQMQVFHATNFGSCISSHRYSFHIYQKSDKTSLSLHQPTHLHPTPETPMDYFI